MQKRTHDLPMTRRPLNSYGSLENAIRTMRNHRPLDLNAQVWQSRHSPADFATWQMAARRCLLEGLHYNPGPVDLQPTTLYREERPDFYLEKIEFNTTPWFRVEGFFLLPKAATAAKPVPGLVVCHAWGGPMLFGKERIVNSGRDHPLLAAHRDIHYSGRYLAEVFASHGYAVVVIDAFHFGSRAPRGLPGLPEEYDPFALSVDEYKTIESKVISYLYLGVKQLNWAGTTWMGVNFWDDSRCIDYLQQRPEVDPGRIGCTGLSGGGWRTNMLAALDERIKASVSVGWMTTGDYQQIYNVQGAIGTFCLLPGVWDRLDVPDLTVMTAPRAAMVVNCAEDPLFPPEAQAEAERQIYEGYAWAGAPDKAYVANPVKGHCYDAEIQEEALAWFDKHLRGRV
ncbi:MAG TPA: hypothetical protein GXX29_02235 [Firmicutes bacterium]|nr:hypothetical protein [Bacillota bacterium]